ncbi:MAG: class I SAM-dependent methyltransferase [Acidobacteriota bacterium]
MRDMLSAVVGLVLVLSPIVAGQGTAHRLFPPEDLAILEGPDREEWQQPDRIMDALGIADGSKVADIGAGGGWFTVRLARRVQVNGIVYAEDVQKEMLDSISRRVSEQRPANVRMVLGTSDDPRLPPGLHAALMVDTYPQIPQPDRITFLRNVAKSLAPDGRLGIVDFKTDGAGGPGPPLDERLAPEIVRRDAQVAGLRLMKEETFLRYQYLLIFGK